MNWLAGGILAQLWYANAHIDLIFSQANRSCAADQHLVTWKLKHATGTSGIGDNTAEEWQHEEDLKSFVLT